MSEEIINRLHLDDHQAMKQVFRLYYAPLCNYAKRYVESITIAEEIVSDVLYKIWQNRHYIQAKTFREYLYTATRNTAINYLTQQQNQRRLADEWAEQLRHELIDETPLNDLILSEIEVKYHDLINHLPEQCRKVFLLSRTENRTYEEIATQMNISVNTVKHHIKVALQKLRDGLSEFLIWFALFIDYIF
ncbi:RNA polymerase sigma-70 factor (ECF subfamily) [Parabacteroides sp. PF5-5]|uniref:RNA polymerase sigma-70 factor n=1 Tax=unclassified Parabacteroides TaxID=2649774 RepID=UPI0024769569|nr:MULTISPECIES: RNA polymerase sigma-70 factor [unclassified Parabacteroides]MDH6303711.1 RNA polymerase sigma-70 factor (ECF subfamily) [Parabacteroides sp. PH5-39]MDH6314328.1 RNA polymerase sigma-70 factor (ECF subfamily) [Parabacteroides sp. PF5-13]MDH6318608.1 RNA polymerase sigma-70 factor (ECF subfamily) [Parabacteroides sp. PH5-13]MDH6322100.1 RNA polymerase sigma-70 factor (ECF subfamily) [Parabacteroides sp. PH5-8]MDH6325821.1 RNA polymerase sigma-70 factor (ECF subfamily) [Parabact